MNLDARDQHRLTARIEHLGGLARSLGDLMRIGGMKMQIAVPFDDLVGHLDFAIDHVR